MTPPALAIELNGEPVELEDGATVRDAITATGVETVDGRGFAVAVDGEVVPRSEWESTILETGQKVEVVAAVQGG